MKRQRQRNPWANGRPVEVELPQKDIVRDLATFMSRRERELKAFLRSNLDRFNAHEAETDVNLVERAMLIEFGVLISVVSCCKAHQNDFLMEVLKIIEGITKD